MDQNYNDYIFEINIDLVVTQIASCRIDTEISDPEIAIDMDTKSITFDFGWHIFDFIPVRNCYLCIAIKKNSIGIFCFDEQNELPFMLTKGDEIFVGSFEVSSEKLTIVQNKGKECSLLIDQGIIITPLKTCKLEYFGTAQETLRMEPYFIRILLNQCQFRGGLLIQQGSEGFFPNILTPFLNRISLTSKKMDNSILIQEQIHLSQFEKNDSFTKSNYDTNIDINTKISEHVDFYDRLEDNGQYNELEMNEGSFFDKNYVENIITFFRKKPKILPNFRFKVSNSVRYIVKELSIFLFSIILISSLVFFLNIAFLLL